MQGKECLRCGHMQEYTDTVPDKCNGCGAYYAKVEAQAKRALQAEKKPKKPLVSRMLEGVQAAQQAPKLAEIQARSAQNTLVRNYRFKSQKQAVAAYQREAAELKEEGFVATDQLWEQGSWGCAPFLFGTFLLLAGGLGLLVYVYLIIVKPNGTLTVTYKKDTP